VRELARGDGGAGGAEGGGRRAEAELNIEITRRDIYSILCRSIVRCTTTS
jgi:hypothetical protein